MHRWGIAAWVFEEIHIRVTFLSVTRFGDQPGWSGLEMVWTSWAIQTLIRSGVWELPWTSHGTPVQRGHGS